MDRHNSKLNLCNKALAYVCTFYMNKHGQSLKIKISGNEHKLDYFILIAVMRIGESGLPSGLCSYARHVCFGTPILTTRSKEVRTVSRTVVAPDPSGSGGIASTYPCQPALSRVVNMASPSAKYFTASASRGVVPG